MSSANIVSHQSNIMSSNNSLISNQKSNNLSNYQNPVGNSHTKTEPFAPIDDHPILICLAPIYDKTESVSNRPALTLSYFPSICYEETSMIRLGRNDTTKIQEEKISPSLATVSILEQDLMNDMHEKDTNSSSQTLSSQSTKTVAKLKIILTIHHVSNSDKIQINGVPCYNTPHCEHSRSKSHAYIELYHGDIISLYENKYKYKVYCVNPDQSMVNDSRQISTKAVCSADDNFETKAEEVVCTQSTDHSMISQKPKELEQPVSLSTSSSTSSSQSSSSLSTSNPVKLKTEESGLHHSLQQQPQQEQPSGIKQKLNPIQIQAQSNILHEIKCPICLEILVDSTSVNPCGHIFCYKCITDLMKKNGNPFSAAMNQFPFHSHCSKGTHCPTCREGIGKITRVKKHDDLIWNIICLNQSLFNYDDDNNVKEEIKGDLENYLERCDKSIDDLNNDEKVSIFGATGMPSSSNAKVKQSILQSTSPAKSRQKRKREKKVINNNSISSHVSRPLSRRRVIDLFPLEPHPLNLQLDHGHYDLTNIFFGAPAPQQPDGQGSANDPIEID